MSRRTVSRRYRVILCTSSHRTDRPYQLTTLPHCREAVSHINCYRLVLHHWSGHKEAKADLISAELHCFATQFAFRDLDVRYWLGTCLTNTAIMRCDQHTDILKEVPVRSLLRSIGRCLTLVGSTHRRAEGDAGCPTLVLHLLLLHHRLPPIMMRSLQGKLKLRQSDIQLTMFVDVRPRHLHRQVKEFPQLSKPAARNSTRRSANGTRHRSKNSRSRGGWDSSKLRKRICLLSISDR